MQKGPSQVSSGNIAPAVMGPQKETKEVVLLAGLVLFLGGLIAAAWYYGQLAEPVKITPAAERIENASVSDLLKKASVLNQAEASPTQPTPVTAPVVSPADIIHADVYFEIGRKGLTDEAKAQLSAQADLLKQHEDYGVLIQGYTDQQGSASYNMKLGLKRAEAVKAELVNAGIAEHRIKTVSLGEEGVLCVDSSDLCRHMNRRVHVEIRKIGQEHMAAPAVGAAATEPAKTEDIGTGADSSSPSDPTAATSELPTGS
jgi:peptidoglycan-associated lipoprotein